MARSLTILGVLLAASLANADTPAWSFDAGSSRSSDPGSNHLRSNHLRSRNSSATRPSVGYLQFARCKVALEKGTLEAGVPASLAGQSDPTWMAQPVWMADGYPDDGSDTHEPNTLP